MVPGQGKNSVSVLNYDHCEGLTFPYFFPIGKFGYKEVLMCIPLSGL